MFSKRAEGVELMDRGPEHYTAAEYQQCLTQLGRIGHWMGDSATQRAIDKFAAKPASILDVGCGGGQLARRLAQRYSDCKVVGIDIEPAAIAYAQERSGGLPNLTYALRENPVLSEPSKSFDVVIASLVCHHLSDDDIVQFLVAARRVARRAVIINDLHRHPISWMTFGLIAPVLFPNRLILCDGLLSIRKGFVRQDWNAYLARAHCEQSAVVTWHWPFRWLVAVKP